MRKRIQAVFTLMSDLKKNQFSGMDSEDGSAMVIALLIMMLLMGFVALAITRTNSETMASANDATESRTFDAANASLEVMTRNFSKIFDTKLNPDAGDLSHVASLTPPGFPDYTFGPINGSGGQLVQPTGTPQPVIMKGGDFQGLNALQDSWVLNTTATNTATGVQVALQRRFLNNRIPIFQFGVFYDDDMEFHPGPVFNFGGRVHSNGNIFLAASSGLTFTSKVTADKNIFTDVSKSGRPYTDWGDNVFVKNGSGVPVQVHYNMGSVLTTPSGTPVPNSTSNPVPTAYTNPGWDTFKKLFDGNLLANESELKLPLKINAQINGQPIDLVELVKRGKNINTANNTGDLFNNESTTVTPGVPANAPGIVPVSSTTKDDLVTAAERYYNKTGIRVSLADSKAKLPGCALTSTGAAVGTPCGAQLDGSPDGVTAYVGGVRGYNPNLTPMTGGAYPTTEINGERFFTPGKEIWIKIETVAYNATTQNYDTVDITKDILALGVTERAPDLCNGAASPCTKFRIVAGNYWSTNADSRSIIKLQRFMAAGPWATSNTSIIPTGGTPSTAYIQNNANLWTPNQTYNYVEPSTVASGNTCNSAAAPTWVNSGPFPNGLVTNRNHWKDAEAPGAAGANPKECVEAFPINMFDTREGLYNDTALVFNPTAAGNYGTNVPWAGVMSMVDIDIANLKNFLDGNLDGGANPGLPTAGTPFSTNAGRALKSTDIPSANGWVLYVSDRRGDRDFDGEYDMEDIFGPNDGGMPQLGEDVNGDGILEADYSNNNAGAVGAQEGVKYVSAGLFTPPFVVATGWGSYVSPGVAAVFEHPFYRRGVRLVNGSDLPGSYNTGTPTNSRGFTVASENGVYVKGNYNATGVASHGSPTAYTAYNPQGADVPASVAADAITVLSNNWSDARSFKSPFTMTDRDATETTDRFAILGGDAITTLGATPNQGGSDVRMNGGVHNFKRFLEDWGGVYLNYTGSLINLYYAHNNNGAFKCCNDVYSPPTRNWVFDASFLDINRIPPGTPFFQSIQITGFQRINN